jgi:hypothetical protein
LFFFYFRATAILAEYGVPPSTTQSLLSLPISVSASSLQVQSAPTSTPASSSALHSAQSNDHYGGNTASGEIFDGIIKEDVPPPQMSTNEAEYTELQKKSLDLTSDDVVSDSGGYCQNSTSESYSTRSGKRQRIEQEQLGQVACDQVEVDVGVDVEVRVDPRALYVKWYREGQLRVMREALGALEEILEAAEDEDEDDEVESDEVEVEDDEGEVNDDEAYREK